MYGDVKGCVFTVPISNRFQSLSLLDMYYNMGDIGVSDPIVQCNKELVNHS